MLANINIHLFLKGSDNYLNIYLFNKQLSSAHYVPGTALGATVNKENKVSYEVYNMIYFFQKGKSGTFLWSNLETGFFAREGKS